MELKPAVAGADRLSSLPAQLQDEILVRLDLRDAVRTSVLSRTWRHLWKSLSVLSLSFPFGAHLWNDCWSPVFASLRTQINLVCIPR